MRLMLIINILLKLVFKIIKIIQFDRFLELFAIIIEFAISILFDVLLDILLNNLFSIDTMILQLLDHFIMVWLLYRFLLNLFVFKRMIEGVINFQQIRESHIIVILNRYDPVN